jgi:hypothetical protein
MTKHSAKPDLYVLDALSNDMENIDGVLRMLNSDSVLSWKREWGHEFSRLDVVTALSRLVRDDMVRVLVPDDTGTALRELPATTMPSSDYDGAYFAITGRGRMIHAAWDPEIGKTNR